MVPDISCVKNTKHCTCPVSGINSRNIFRMNIELYRWTTAQPCASHRVPSSRQLPQVDTASWRVYVDASRSKPADTKDVFSSAMSRHVPTRWRYMSATPRPHVASICQFCQRTTVTQRQTAVTIQRNLWNVAKPCGQPSCSKIIISLIIINIITIVINIII